MDAILHKHVRLACAPMEAYAWFADSERAASWLAAEAEIEHRVGGKFELFWDPGDRAHNSTRGCKITALAPGQLLAFEWKGPREFEKVMNAADPLTHVVVAFAPSPAGEGTDVHLIHSGWRSGPDWEAARQWFDRAWTMAFQELVALNADPTGA